MAVEQYRCTLAEAVALRLGQLIQQRPMLLDSHGARGFRLAGDFRTLHTAHIPSLAGIVNAAGLGFDRYPGGWNWA